MECYQHKTQAVGICKQCCKAVCRECIGGTMPNNIIGCSDECRRVIADNEEMNERARRLYGIGVHKTTRISTHVKIWFLLAAIMWIIGIAQSALLSSRYRSS